MLGRYSFPHKPFHSCTISHIINIQDCVPPDCPSCQHGHVLGHEGFICFVIKVIRPLKAVLIHFTA